MYTRVLLEEQAYIRLKTSVNLLAVLMLFPDISLSLPGASEGVSEGYRGSGGVAAPINGFKGRCSRDDLYRRQLPG